jgi:hypothetical protein
MDDIMASGAIFIDKREDYMRDVIIYVFW